MSSAILTSLFAAGVAIGLLFSAEGFFAANEHDEHDITHETDLIDDHDDHEEEEDHVALTKQAFDNLGLKLGKPTSGDYWKSILVPGKVVEIPGRSDLAVSAAMAGVVESVNVVPGESISAESVIFTIRLTDEALLAAQAKYLETLTQQEVAEQEIARLAPLIESGAVSGTKKRDLEYEVRQLAARQSTLLQELRGRGMQNGQIAALQQNRQLASRVSVYAPSFVTENTAQWNGESGYSLETLLVYPGKSVSRGESLCTVAYHRNLYIEGTAFEVDLPALENIASQGWLISAGSIAGSELESAHDSLALRLLRVDNHVHETTQTVRFFVELPNEITQTLHEDGRRFAQWRYRPGQRMHLRLPVELWHNQLRLPTDAVVVDGPNVIVFVEHEHGEHDDEMAAEADADSLVQSSAARNGLDVAEEYDHHDEHEIFIELEPVSVRLLHRDDETIVVARDGRIHDDERIALNNAHKLYLAMKMQAGGGGGHHHHHDH